MTATVRVSKDQIQDYLSDCGTDAIKITSFCWDHYNNRPEIEWDVNLYQYSDLEYEDEELYEEDALYELQAEIEQLKVDKEVLDKKCDDLQSEVDRLQQELVVVRQLHKQTNWFKWFK